jgi:hypothetical protein
MALSEDEQLLAEERWRDPTRAEMRQLLEKYFVVPISEQFVDLIEARFLAGLEDRGAWASYCSHFQSMTRWTGKAWYEDPEFTFNRRQMTPRHLVVLIANSIADRTYDGTSVPQPKLYCPPMFVGAWQQIEPKVDVDPCLWHLAADGGFRHNNPNKSPELKYWYASRLTPDSESYELDFLREPTGPSPWGIYGVKPPQNGELAGVELLPSGKVPYRFRRV